VELGSLAQRLEQPRRLARELRGIGVLERVLILRAAHARRDGQVLHGLEVEVDALDARELRLEAADDVARGHAPLVERLQVHQDAPAVEGHVRAVDADERGDARDGGVLEEHARKRALPVRHRREGDRLRRLGDAEDRAGVLDREEPLRDDDVEHDRQCQHRDGDQQRRPLVVEHPAQRRAVALDRAVEDVLRDAIEAALLLGRRVAQQARTHHRREGQRDDRRDEDRDAERDRELAEEAADHVPHEEERDQHRDQRDREREDREADLRRAYERRLARRAPLLDVAGDVLDHHDRVVDDETGRDRERHQRQVVQAEAEEVHDAERPDEREWDRDRGNDRAGDAPQEQEDHEDDEHDREEELELHVLDRGADRRRPVGEHGDVDAGGERALQVRQERGDAVDDLDDVRAGLALHVQDHRRRVVHPRRLLHVLGVVDDVGDVVEADRRAVPIRDHDRSIVLAREELVVRADRERARRTVESALGPVHVRRDDGEAHVLERQAVGGERGRICADAHRRALAAAHRHEADARHLGDLLGEARVGEVFDARQRQRLRAERERQDRRVRRIHLAVDRWDRKVRRQKGERLVDGGLHLLLRDVEGELEAELQRDDRAAVRARRGHLREPRHLAELSLERRRHRRRHDVGTAAWIERHDLDRRIVDLGERGDRQAPVAEDAGQQDRHHEQRGRDGSLDEWTGQAHEASPCAGGVDRRVWSVTRAPGRSPSAPSTTSRSPSATPAATEASAPSVTPSVTGRISTV
jgi:hypothetical protein